MKPPVTEKEVSLLLQKSNLDFTESYQLSTYAIFLILVGKVLQKEESGKNENPELDKVVKDELGPYRTSGSRTILKLAETCDRIAAGNVVDREHRSEAINVLRYIDQRAT
jgi:hypothetical protein